VSAKLKKNKLLSIIPSDKSLCLLATGPWVERELEVSIVANDSISSSLRLHDEMGKVCNAFLFEVAAFRVEQVVKCLTNNISTTNTLDS